jgi:hypothetical protein
MIAKLFQSAAALIAVALVVAALWGWNEAGRLAMFWKRPDVGEWGIRSGAVSGAAAAQVLLLAFVAGKLFRRNRVAGPTMPRRDVLGTGLKIGAGVVCAGALVSAVALGLAGR